MTTDRPLLGDVYVGYDIVGYPKAVRVIGYTAKRVIVEQVPVLSTRTLCDRSADHHIDMTWLQRHPPPTPPPTKCVGADRVLMRDRYYPGDANLVLVIGSRRTARPHFYHRVVDPAGYGHTSTDPD